MGEIDEEIRQLAKDVPQEVLHQLNEDEKVWNRRFKWTEYTWTGHKTGRQVQLFKKYRENGVGEWLTEEQFTQRRKEYIRDRLKNLAMNKVG